MKENIYVIYDVKSQIALKPFMIQRNDVVPIRELTELVQNKDTVLHKHAEDFHLIQIATIDIESLEMEILQQPRVAVRAQDCIDKTD